MSAPPRVTPVTAALDALGVPYRFFAHAGPVHSLAQAAAERGQTPEQIIRSIVFRVAAGEFVMVLAAGERRIAWPALRQYLGVSRVTMAERDEVKAVTGYELGAVSPFGLPAPMRILIDESVFAASQDLAEAPAEISLGSGVRGTTVILTRADLLTALGDAPRVRLSEGAGENDLS